MLVVVVVVVVVAVVVVVVVLLLLLLLTDIPAVLLQTSFRSSSFSFRQFLFF